MSGPSEAVSLRLVLAKRHLAEGERFVDRTDGVGRMDAILKLDLAVETALKTLVFQREGRAISGIGFGSLVRRAASLIAMVPAAVLLLHDLRNNAQHAGDQPEEDLKPHRDAAVACVRQVFDALGADFEKFNLVHMIENPQTRELLDEAIAHVDEDPDAAVRLASHAFRRLRGMVEHLLGHAYGLPMWMFRTPRFSDVREQSRCGDGRDKFVGILLRGLAGVLLGLDPSGHLRFRRLAAGRVLRRTDSEDGVELTADDETVVVAEPSVADALWTIDYVSRVAVGMERAYPEVRQFGPNFTIGFPDPQGERIARLIPRAFRVLDDDP